MRKIFTFLCQFSDCRSSWRSQAALPVPHHLRAHFRRRTGPEGPPRPGLPVHAVLQRRQPGALRPGTAARAGPPTGRPPHAPARPGQQLCARQAHRQARRVSSPPPQDALFFLNLHFFQTRVRSGAICPSDPIRGHEAKGAAPPNLALPEAQRRDDRILQQSSYTAAGKLNHRVQIKQRRT